VRGGDQVEVKNKEKVKQSSASDSAVNTVSWLDLLAPDERLHGGNIKRYLVQCGLATAVVLVLLLVMDTVTQTALIAALALGIVINEWHLLTLVVVMAGAIVLSMVKQLILPLLMDL
jgi:hypothetical protein